MKAPPEFKTGDTKGSPSDTEEAVVPGKPPPECEGGQVTLMSKKAGWTRIPGPPPISRNMSPKKKELYVEFLKHNQCVLGWTYSEMPGFDPT